MCASFSHMTAWQELQESLSYTLIHISHTGSNQSFVFSVKEQCGSNASISCLNLFFVRGATDLIDVVCCPVPQLCLTLCNPMDYSTPGFPVLHYLSEFAQTHVH